MQPVEVDDNYVRKPPHPAVGNVCWRHAPWLERQTTVRRQEEPLASVREADLQPPCPAKPALDRLQSLFGAPGTALTVRQLKPSLMGRDDDPTRSHGIVISMLLPGDAGPYGEA